ncbi:hypothetical protein ACRRTK_023124 [Alexandromys fortis]
MAFLGTDPSHLQGHFTCVTGKSVPSYIIHLPHFCKDTLHIKATPDYFVRNALRIYLGGIVAQVQSALGFHIEQQLQVWEPSRTPSPEPETKEEAPTPVCTPSAEGLKEPEFLTQALEKAVRASSQAGSRASGARSTKDVQLATLPAKDCSNTKELQTLATLRLRVAVLAQQIHLEKL